MLRCSTFIKNIRTIVEAANIWWDWARLNVLKSVKLCSYLLKTRWSSRLLVPGARRFAATTLVYVKRITFQKWDFTNCSRTFEVLTAFETQSSAREEGSGYFHNSSLVYYSSMLQFRKFSVLKFSFLAFLSNTARREVRETFGSSPSIFSLAISRFDVF